MIDDSTPTPSASRTAFSSDIPSVWPYNEIVEPRRGLLVVISGPSAAGKDAVIDALAQEGVEFTKIVTATTRTQREGEIPGRDYHFLSTEEFFRWRDAGLLLEWAMVYGTPYGTPVAGVREALSAGQIVILKIDVQGAAQIKAKAPNALFIYLGPGSFEELKQRLARRGTETEEAYQWRIDQARDELLQVPQYEYLVINRQGELASAVDQVRSIILAERLRIRPRPIDLT